MALWKNRTQCRLCCNNILIDIFNLEPTPPANHFILEKKKQTYIPLDIAICKQCNHIQLLQIIDPKILYEDYLYVSSTTNTMINHLYNSIDYYIEYINLNKTDNILEIGANDGTCIKYLLDKGFMNTIGVDPAKNIKLRHDLPIICDFFGSNLHDELLNKYGKFKMIFGFHCFAHIENIEDVFKTAFELLEDDGLFIMEVGYFYDVFTHKTFDTIYHEHIDYYTCTSIKNYCDNNQLKLCNIKNTHIQGGSMQFYICKQSTNKYLINYNSINNTINKENNANLFIPNNLINWFSNINNIRDELQHILHSIKQNNKKIAGYGASAKSTTFMHQFKITDNILEYIIDDNIYKINRYSPGFHIPITSIDILDNNKVDYIIILSWNFTNDIIKKLNKYITDGLKIIIPFPNIQII